MAEKRRILFLCTGNACRSQMAEAILRHLGGDRFESLSAGSFPAGFVHELATEAMRRLAVPMKGAVSKSWDRFAETTLDVVITLCDDAASEVCPVWLGSPLMVHWSTPDPSFHPGSAEERVDLAVSIAERLQTKIQGLVDLDWSMKRDQIRKRLEFLGEI